MNDAGDRYDTIGRTYAVTRREDQRIASIIHDGLGSSTTVINVGAGSGNYEPDGRAVVAVEPSQQMIDQRRGDRAPAVQGVAEHLPFADDRFDAAMAILTVHHWSDPARGLRELARVARRQVVFYFEPLQTHAFWALDYFPTALDLPTEKNPPGEALLRAHLDVREIREIPVPHDCVDGFGAAFWARPEAYCDPIVQAGMSWLAMLTDAERSAGAERLRGDLESGEWQRRYGHLLEHETYDAGYRLAIAGGT